MMSTELNAIWIKAIFITRDSGEILVNFTNDPNIHTDLLSAFISGLFLFGKESVQRIEEIFIKGPDLELLIVYKHGLILTAIFSVSMVKMNLRAEAEQVLDAFYEKYCESLPNWTGCTDDFLEFTDILKAQITAYFSRVRSLPKVENTNPRDQKEFFSNESKGFWSRLIRSLKGK
jgi:hypothetical protein